MLLLSSLVALLPLAAVAVAAPQPSSFSDIVSWATSESTLSAEDLAASLASDRGGGGKSWKWKSCGSDDDAVLPDSIAISPDPPVAGQNLTVTVVGSVIEPVEEGAYADVLVKLGLIKILQKRFDVCEEAENADAQVQCPVAAGVYAVTQKVELPEIIPKAIINIKAQGWTAQDDPMFCVDLSIDFLHRF